MKLFAGFIHASKVSEHQSVTSYTFPSYVLARDLSDALGQGLEGALRRFSSDEGYFDQSARFVPIGRVFLQIALEGEES